MKLDREQTKIIITALYDYSSNQYLNNNNKGMVDTQRLIHEIQEEMGEEFYTMPFITINGGKEIDKATITVDSITDTSTKNDVGTLTIKNEDTDEVGSETGIERDYYNQGKPNCEVCDD